MGFQKLKQATSTQENKQNITSYPEILYCIIKVFIVFQVSENSYTSSNSPIKQHPFPEHISHWSLT